VGSVKVATKLASTPAETSSDTSGRWAAAAVFGDVFDQRNRQRLCRYALQHGVVNTVQEEHRRRVVCDPAPEVVVIDLHGELPRVVTYRVQDLAELVHCAGARPGDCFTCRIHAGRGDLSAARVIGQGHQVAD